MSKWKEFLNKICFPHIVIVVIITAISVCGLVYSFCYANALLWIQYLSYALSAYALTVICCRIPSLVKVIKVRANKNKLMVKYTSDINFRTKITLYINLSTNTLFSLFYLYMGIANKSLWFYSLAVYYILLSVTRVLLLKDSYNQSTISEIKQWQRYRVYGIFLVTINIALSIITFFVIKKDKGFSYHFIETIAIALFTFIITTLAIINSIKYRKFHDPIITATKFVGLSSALVSMFSLETAMLSVFGTEKDYKFRIIMTTITGAVFCVIILAIGLFMIIKSTREIKKKKAIQEYSALFLEND